MIKFIMTKIIAQCINNIKQSTPSNRILNTASGQILGEQINFKTNSSPVILTKESMVRRMYFKMINFFILDFFCKTNIRYMEKKPYNFIKLINLIDIIK